MLTGVLAAAAYVGAMELDIALSHYPGSDLHLIERLARAREPLARAREREFPQAPAAAGAARRRPGHVPWAGFLAHMANGAGLGVIYALVQRWLPGPAWLRGILLSEGFILRVWPTTPLLDRFHPLIRQGQLPPFARRVVFWQNLSRHLVFGLVLGESLRLLKQGASAQR